jgi:hypothetical protein
VLAQLLGNAGFGQVRLALTAMRPASSICALATSAPTHEVSPWPA